LWFNSMILSVSFTHLCACVGFWTSGPQQGIKFQLRYGCGPIISPVNLPTATSCAISMETPPISLLTFATLLWVWNNSTQALMWAKDPCYIFDINPKCAGIHSSIPQHSVKFQHRY
jgi:hypothetical protein